MASHSFVFINFLDDSMRYINIVNKLFELDYLSAQLLQPRSEPDVYYPRKDPTHAYGNGRVFSWWSLYEKIGTHYLKK